MATNYCDIVTSGLTLSCTRGSNVGGISTVWITSLPVLTATTETAAHVISALQVQSISGTNQFFKYELLRESGEWNETIQADPTKGVLYYESEIKLFFSKRQTTTRNQIMLMAKNRLAVILEDNNGTLWLPAIDSIGTTAIFGGLDVDKGSTANTGKAAADQNGYNIVLRGISKDMSREVSAAAVALVVDSL